jgi:hypothetical protein
MRVIAAALFVFIGMLLVAGGLGEHMRGWPPIAMSAVMGGSLVALLVLAHLIFNRGWHLTRGPSLAELQARGLVREETYDARRVFEVAEHDDEGMHYFIELNDGRVLYLTGQFLYDFVEITDDPEANQPQTFPSARFTLKRHATSGAVLDLVPEGAVIRPEVVLPPFSREAYRSGMVSTDEVKLYADRTYDDLLATFRAMDGMAP